MVVSFERLEVKDKPVVLQSPVFLLHSNAAKEKDYQLILMDCHMPEMNGDELIEMLKPEIPASCRIVMMSAHSDLGEWIDAKKLGIDVLLSKPINLSKLKQSLAGTNQKIRRVSLSQVKN